MIGFGFRRSGSCQQTRLLREASSPAQPYKMRDGYWSQHVDQWIWQPSYWLNTPDGFLEVTGYWDYEPQYRGQAYAAVSFPPERIAMAPFEFQPLYPLARDASLLMHLFTLAGSRQFYYGDLYSDRFAELGYLPWVFPETSTIANASRPIGDLWQVVGSAAPLRQYFQWKYRPYGIDFTASMQRYPQHFRSAPSIRPAVQLLQQPELALTEGLAGSVLAEDFDQVVRGNVNGRGPIDVNGQQYSAGTSRAKLPMSEPARSAPQSLADGTSSSSEDRPNANGTGGAPRRNSAEAQLPNRLPTLQSSIPRGAAAFRVPGAAATVVLPGGRIVQLPLGVLPPGPPIDLRGGLIGPPQPPFGPPPQGGLRGRFGRR